MKCITTNKNIRTLVPWTIAISLTNISSSDICKLANDLFVGLKEQLMTCITADNNIGQLLSCHHHYAIFVRDTKKF